MYPKIKEWAFATNRKQNLLQRLCQEIVRVIILLFHTSARANIFLRASALTFSIVLTMVPMLALSTSILKGIGSDNDIKKAAYTLLAQIEPGAQKDNGEPAGQSLSSHLHKGLETMFSYVDKTNFAALGAFGVGGLLVVVIMMMNRIENSMNAIWNSDKSRPWGRKIMDYLALLVLLPFSINLSFAGDAALRSEKVMSYIKMLVPSDWLIGMLFKGLPLFFIIASLSFMYKFFPHAKVKPIAAFIGALFATTSWLIIQKIYISLQIGVSNYNAIYGSFATVPLFLIWLQLGWTFLLLGSALAYAVQNKDKYNFKRRNTKESDPFNLLQLAYDIMNEVYTDFEQGKPTLHKKIKRKLDHAEEEIETALQKLEQAGLLHKIDKENEVVFSPAMAKEQVSGKTIFTAIFGQNQEEKQHPMEKIITQSVEQALPAPIFPFKKLSYHADKKLKITGNK